MSPIVHIAPMPALKPSDPEGATGLSLLSDSGPDVVLGESRDASGGLPVPIAPTAETLFGPRGACLVSADGPLWVADTGHHRLLGWTSLPSQDQVAADWIIGQPTFTNEGRNAKGAPSASTLNVPTGVACYGTGLVVADAWNHRVLIWHRVPCDSHVPADLVLGQHDFRTDAPNRGNEIPSAESMHWPFGVWSEGEQLFVADTGNRRVLVWQTPPTRNGQPADLVLGQGREDCRDENAGGIPNMMSMRWPHAGVVWNGNLCVADAGNNRVMVWDGIPTERGAACRWLLGQQAADLVDHNAGLYWPRAETLNMPYGVAVSEGWLVVADTANSRLLGWAGDGLDTGAPARALAGQSAFHAKGDNQWRFPVRTSLCWPYGVHAVGQRVVVADSGNNRVQLWTRSSI